MTGSDISSLQVLNICENNRSDLEKGCSASIEIRAENFNLQLGRDISIESSNRSLIKTITPHVIKNKLGKEKLDSLSRYLLFMTILICPLQTTLTK